jgi:c-di-GMP-related signal transduction protein
MDLFIARQPIFSEGKRLFAYELLYRGTHKVSLNTISGNKATTSVLSSAFLTEGIEKISRAKPCFVNFTKDLLLQSMPFSFPRSQLVVEILEDVPPTPEIVALCTKLKSDGYTIALDDFVYHRSMEPLLQIADIVKFDFRLTPVETLEKTLYRLATYNLRFLAEKVESYEEFIRASKLGFSYFQGYFFARPEKLRVREISSAKVNLVNLLAEVNSKNTTKRKIEKIIQRDVGLAYKLLRYINSAYFYRLKRIESIAHAMVYLGEKELRRFLILVLLSGLASDKPGELLRLAVVRAKMAELLAVETSLSKELDEIFTLGLFSLLPPLLDTTMDYICRRLSLSERLKEALVDGTGPYYPLLEAVISYEKREKDRCLRAIREIGVATSKLHPMYLEAIDFADSVLG